MVIKDGKSQWRLDGVFYKQAKKIYDKIRSSSFNLNYSRTDDDVFSAPSMVLLLALDVIVQIDRHTIVMLYGPTSHWRICRTPQLTRTRSHAHNIMLDFLKLGTHCNHVVCTSE